MFRASSCPSSGATTTAIAASGLPPARPQPTALTSPSSYGKPEAATAVVLAPDDEHEMPETCLAVFK